MCGKTPIPRRISTWPQSPSGKAVESRPMLTDPDYDPLLMGSPLRRGGVCKVISVALLALLAFAALIQLSVVASMRPDMAGVFVRALMLSSLLAVVPLAVLWFLDRRERETPRSEERRVGKERRPRG